MPLLWGNLVHTGGDVESLLCTRCCRQLHGARQGTGSGTALSRLPETQVPRLPRGAVLHPVSLCFLCYCLPGQLN